MNLLRMESRVWGPCCIWSVVVEPDSEGAKEVGRLRLDELLGCVYGIVPDGLQ